MEETDIELGLSEDGGPPPAAAPQLRGSVSERVFSQPQARLPAQTGPTLTRQHSDPMKHTKEAKETPAAPPVLFRQFPSLRALSFKVYSPVVETFYCQICMENVAVSEASFFTGNGICGHRFCKDCLSTYVSGRIVEGQTRHPCPCIGMAVDGGVCETEATREDIAQIVTEDVLGKYDRFVSMKADENHRDCPSCGTMFIGNPRSPEMVCPSCATKFCFFHSNAHPGQTCREYARRTRQDERRSHSTIVQISKACPSCRTRVEKNGGCNHMTCSCGCEWCWLCGRRMGSNHFNAWNFFGCPGSQFANLNSNWLLYPYKLLVLIGALLLGVFVIVTSPLIAYALFKRRDDWDDSLEFAAKWTLLPLLYLVAAVFYVAVVLPVGLLILMPLFSISRKVSTGRWPRQPWRPILLDFDND